MYAYFHQAKIDCIDDYEFDIVLSMFPNFKYNDKVVYISPIVSKTDEKNIKDACFETLSHPKLEKDSYGYDRQRSYSLR